ncbi:MAG: nucleotidyltransferase family protein [Thermoplasmata archaeon]
MSDESEEMVRVITDILLKSGVKRASLFGSFVRGETTDGSDVDLLVEFEGRKSLLDLVSLKIRLERSLGRRVDILTYDSLHPLLRERILKEQKVILRRMPRCS